MTKRIIFLGLACGLLASNTGCGLLGCLSCCGVARNPQCYAPMPGPACGQPCGPECEPACGPPTSPAYQPACGSAPAAACDVPCGPPHDSCGPLTCIFRLFGAGCWPGGGCVDWCGGGCGEMYCGDCCGNPTGYCDPCDRWGNYVGGGVAGHYGGYATGTAPQDVRVDPAPEVVQTPTTTRR